MNSYRVYLLDEQGKCVGIRGFQSKDDQSARVHAAVLSQGRGWVLWKDGKLVGEFSEQQS